MQLRTVHRPKLVQRSDQRWIVVCADCQRDQSTTPVGINTPLKSREVAKLIWENHCERRRPRASSIPLTSPFGSAPATPHAGT